jgi:hypothetical protein
MEKKIREFDAVLSEKENSSLKNSRQEHILFTNFVSGKIRELEDVVLKKYGVRSKGKVIGLAVLNMLDEISKDKNDGKKA